MNREQYLQYRNANTPEPLYEFYKENYKTGIFLAIGDFFRAMQLWEGAMQAFRGVLAYYDHKFEVMIISDINTGRIYKYI